MATSDMMKSETLGIGELITRYKLLHVPTHQRDYAWTEDEVEQFLDDIIRALESQAPDYFMGLIVLVCPDETGAWQILDGQQRLATTTMVYAGIRQWLASAGRDEDENQVQSTFIGVRNLGEQIHRPRLTLNVNNRQRFTELVVNKCPDDLLKTRLSEAPKYSSDRRLIAAATTCRGRIYGLAQQAGTETDTQANRLYALADYLENNVKVVCLEVPTALNAYVLFESLNDRGLDLSILDLLKNYMFGKAGTKLDEVQWQWSRIVTQLGDREADDFLKVYWTSRYGRVQRGQLFGEIRERFGTADKVIELGQALAKAAEQFSALEVPDHDVWAEHTKLSRERIAVLSLLGNRQVRAVLMSALDRFDATQMEKLLRHLEILTVRYQVVGRGRTGALEIACARVASKIYTGELNTPMKVWKQLASLVSSDVEFEGDFLQFSEANAARAKYLLRELEIAARKERDVPDELRPSTGLTLEHILPRNPSPSWNPVIAGDSELRSVFLNRMGNLCLMEGRTNLKQGSGGFTEKTPQYAMSDLVLTKDVADDFQTWDRKAINARQAKLARLALKAWPLPPEG
jgi:Protein of unknown function DUF262/Protein of unknown function (DUF1524)